jgi:FAD/FMN-containing dehydrogenase
VTPAIRRLPSVRGTPVGAGFGTNHGEVVIDLSRLADVRIIDADRHIVRIGGGAIWARPTTRAAPDR